MTIEYKRGMILVQSFGYNMTLYNFYQVVRVSGKAVDLVELERELGESIGFLRWKVLKPKKLTDYKPQDIIKKRINKYGYICINGHNLYEYNPNERYEEDHAD